jgi:two-component system, NarL family, nitrate/nitrite response regulator NarL
MRELTGREDEKESRKPEPSLLYENHAAPEKSHPYDWPKPNDFSNRGRIRVLVADSTRMASELLSSALQADPGINVVATVDSSADVSEIISKLRPEVVLLSTSLEGDDTKGLKLACRLLKAKPELRIVMLLEASSQESVVNAFRAGASGIFSRVGSLHSLRKCIRNVYAGEIWANRDEIRYVLEALASKSRPSIEIAKDRLSALTRRERQVVGLATGGLTNKEIANELEISEHTVKNYMFSIFEKLGLSSRVELTLRSPAQQVVPMRHGTDADDPSIAWLRDLAEEGLMSAQLLMGEIYYQGRRVAQDRMEGYYWCLLAQRYDLSEAAESVRKSLAKEMSPLQVAEAERRVLNWLERKKKAARRA